MSRKELAERAGVSERTLYKALSDPGSVRRGSYAKIADAMSVRVDWLLTGEGQPGGLAYEVRPVGPRLSVRERSPGRDAGPAMTIQEAVRVIAEQLGRSEDEVREHIAKLLVNGGAR